MRPASVDATGDGCRRPAGRAVADASVAEPGRRSAHRHQQSRVEERLSRDARHVQRVVPERRQGEVDREHGLPPGDDRRSGGRETDRPPDAPAVAGAVDGPASDGRPVRQRLRLRLSEQPVVVVADHAAAGRGASADRVRAIVRRGRQRRGSSRRAAETGQPARFGPRRHHPVADAARARGSHQGRPVSRDRS